ncbi:hypothetical protein [Acaryochloris marina]|uniref:Uncharacterized protein n=1 Tax=Acaryochloris marina (strain MBIC 11017) TaxID=329726 RepID=B0CCS7_ACAM1|nr:hypothetical protein [Acaryochloris marina]ABW29239.1 hypothetical protein AM1_4260 [Acaryochloris marina MBIC11017]
MLSLGGHQPFLYNQPKLKQTETENIERWENLNEAKKRIQALSEEVTFVQRQDISLFLLENSSLIPLMEAANSELRKYFTQENFSVELKSGEDYAPAGELVLAVLSQDELCKSSNLFDSFCENWWFSNLKLSNGKLCIEIQFV